MNSKKQFTHYCPLWFLILLSIGSVFLLAFYFHVAILIVAIIINALAWGTGYQMKIDLSEKKFQDSFIVLGVKRSGTIVSFQSIDCIFITREQQTHSYRTKGVHREASWSEYTAIILFGDGQDCALFTETDLQLLLEKLKPWANFCQVKVESRVKSDSYWIDMSQV
jgi:hypothetical protein